MLDLLLPLSTSFAVTDIFDAAKFFQWFMENASYLMVFVFMTVESSFIPFPSEVVVPPAAYLAASGTGDMNTTMIVIAATAGSLCGALINYYLAVWIGRPLVYRFADSRVGHACLLDRTKIQKAEDYFDKHGSTGTFIGRLIPGIRQLISIPAGLARMNMGKFVIFTSLGAGVWNIILAILGVALAKWVPADQLLPTIEKYNGYLSLAGIGLLVICVGVIAYNGFRKKHHHA